MLRFPKSPEFGRGEGSRLIESGKSRRIGYGSVVSRKSESCNPRGIPEESKDMAADSHETRMQHQDDHGEHHYRRITAENVYLPKEKWYRRIRIPGVYNRSSSHSNVVHTTKYTVLTFLPKNLWEQFHRFANLYFLFIALLNFVPAVEAFGKEIGFVPLLFVLTVTAVKDVFEDFRRYRSDREVNSKLCRVYDQ